MLHETDKRREVTDFFCVATLMDSRGWRPEDSVRLHLVADAGYVRAIYYPTGMWQIECADPWGTGNGSAITVQSSASYGLLTNLMEHMRMLSSLRTRDDV